MTDNLKQLSAFKTQSNLSLKNRLIASRLLYDELLALKLNEINAYEIASVIYGNPDSFKSIASCYQYLKGKGINISCLKTFYRVCSRYVGTEFVISLDGRHQLLQEYKLAPMKDGYLVISLEFLPEFVTVSNLK